MPCGRAMRAPFAGFKVTDTATFGTGGLVEFEDSETRHAKLPAGLEPSPSGPRGIYTVAIDPGGRYAFTGPISPILPGPTIGTRPASFAGPDRAAHQFLLALRRTECGLFYRVTLTPGLGRSAACARGLGHQYAPLAKQLKDDAGAKPVRFGGTRDLTFYGLRTGGQYRTLIVLKNLPGQAQPYLVMGAFRGPSS